MALKSTFSHADIRKELEAGIKQVKEAFLQILKQAGEESVQIARANAHTIDASGRLAASIGYVIVADGMVVAKDFLPMPDAPASAPDGTEAEPPVNEAQQGESLAYELAAQYGKGYALIVVSGSEYAVQAESMSKDVLTGAEMYVGKTVTDALEKLRKGKV
ncbi:hypothetical protein [Emticicia fluvialis]|uniref:hypothetical protein n=1 Tax=Emticicia fluvialis TaxID=2974474 RepID=UPI002165E2CA|nr:hypothetical protein [Emticicia fluvialis]